MYETLIEPFVALPFMRRTLVGGVALSFSIAPVGVFLMLRRMSLMGDVLAHALLPGVAIGYLLAGLSLFAMMSGAFVAAVMVAVVSGIVSRTTPLTEDASLAGFYVLSLSLGVVLVSVGGDYHVDGGEHVDLLHILFGHAEDIDKDALFLMASVSTLTLFALAFLLRPLIMECVDSRFLQSFGATSALTHMAFLGLVALNLVAGFHALGTLMVVGLMILPAITARFWTTRIIPMVGVAVGVSLVSGVGGILIAHHGDIPLGPAIILTIGGMALVSGLVGPVGSLMTRLYTRPHLER